METVVEEIAGTIGSAPVCSSCGSERVVTDAWACWNPQSGLWDLEASFDHAYCQVCEGATTLRWVRAEEPTNARVQELNDAFRKHGHGNGTILVTRGVADLGQDQVLRVVEMVRAFDTFTEDNDPYGEHDFGAIEVDGEKIFWKIDTYDLKKEGMSPNPGNLAVTHRVLTIMLANEY